MDFSNIGFDLVWQNEEQTQVDARKAMISGLLFAWFSGNLLISIIRTISTSPGNIPDDREWDMMSSENEDILTLI